jgi:hypothetical protein
MERSRINDPELTCLACGRVGCNVRDPEQTLEQEEAEGKAFICKCGHTTFV